MKLVVLVLVALALACFISSPVSADTHAHIIVTAQGLVTVPLPPTNFVVTTTENTSTNTSFWCMNLSWTKGLNSPTTIIVICKNGAMTCPNKSITNLSSNCMVLYNGNGTNLSSCGWQFDYYEYNILAWGVDIGGNYSTKCTALAIGGERMLNMAYTGIAMFLALGLTIVSFWQRKTWIFFLAGMGWIGFAANGLLNGNSGEVIWYLGWLGVAAGLVMFTAPTWLLEKHEPLAEEDYEETLEKIYMKEKHETF